MTNSLELRRPRHDAPLLGVCAGLARFWSVDPNLVRAGLIIATVLTNGLAFAAYLLLALVVPADGAAEPPIHRMFPATRSWSMSTKVAVVAVAGSAVALITQAMAPGLFFVMAMAGLIIVWGRRHNRTTGRPAAGASLAMPAAPAATASEFERLSYAWQARQYAVYTGMPLDPAEQPTPSPERRREPGRNRPWLGVLVGFGVIGGVFAALESAAGIAIPEVAWASAVLAVLGLTLLWVSRPTRRSRRRPTLMVTTTVLTACVAGLMMASPPDAPTPPRLPAMPSSQQVVYGDIADLPHTIEADIGDHTIDLRDLQVTENRTLRVEVNIGNAEIRVPTEGNVIIRYTVDAGRASILGTTSEGVDRSGTVERIQDPDEPTLTINLSVDLGNAEVK